MLESVEGLMEQAWIRIEVQDAAHFLLRLAAGACVGHGQGGGNAVRRKEEVAWIGLELRVEFEGESGIAAHAGFGPGGLSTGGKPDSAGKHEQDRKAWAGEEREAHGGVPVKNWGSSMEFDHSETFLFELTN